MPPVVAAIAAVVTAVGATVTAILTPIIGATLAASVTTFLVQLAIGAVISSVMGELTPKPKAMEQGQQLATKLDPAYPREVCVGHYATGGSLFFENVSGTNNKYLWRCIAISDSDIQNDTQLLVQGVALTFSGDIHTGLRACTSNFLGKGSASRLYVRIHQGSQSQTADADLLAAFPGLLSSNFRGRGVAYAVIRMEYDTEAWQGGADFVFTGSGASVYDPRTATTAFSANAALVGRQFLAGFTNNSIRVVGLGASSADLPDADYMTAADTCDEAITLTAGGTEPRYRVGGVISGREVARDVLAHLVAAMGGKHIDRGGEIVLLPGATRASVQTIKESDLLADVGISYAAKVTADERFNAISSTFVDPTTGYQEGPLPPRVDTSAVTADGERLETTRAYRFVNSYTQGQRLDQIELRNARAEGRLSIGAPLWAFERTPGDVVTINSPRWGSVDKLWIVASLQLAITSGAQDGQPQARCILSLTETTSTAFAWNNATDEIARAGTTTYSAPGPIGSLVDGPTDRINTVDGLPLGSAGGTGIVRSVTAPLSSASSSTIAVAAHNAQYVGVTYAIPSGTITGLSTDTGYYVFYRLSTAAFVTTSSAATATTYYIDASDYVPIGTQRTQTAGGGYTPPPPPPSGGGGGGGSGGGGVYNAF